MTESGFPLIALEIVLGFLVPLAWGVWQLVELRRLERRDRERVVAAAAREGGAGPASGG
jgi:hypothetical protein